MAKNKKATVNLDEILDKNKISIVPEADVVKMKDAKFTGGAKKLPSLIARSIADALFAKPNEGRGVSTDGMSQETKEAMIRTMRKDLSRCIKGAAAKNDKLAELRVRAVDQGNVIKFFFDKKKDKKVGEKKAATGGRR